MLFGRLKETMNCNWVRVTSGLCCCEFFSRSINCHKCTGFVNMLVRWLDKCAIAHAVGCWLPWHATIFSSMAIYGILMVWKVAHCIDLLFENIARYLLVLCKFLSQNGSLGLILDHWLEFLVDRMALWQDFSWVQCLLGIIISPGPHCCVSFICFGHCKLNYWQNNLIKHWKLKTSSIGRIGPFFFAVPGSESHLNEKDIEVCLEVNSGNT